MKAGWVVGVMLLIMIILSAGMVAGDHGDGDDHDHEDDPSKGTGTEPVNPTIACAPDNPACYTAFITGCGNNVACLENLHNTCALPSCNPTQFDTACAADTLCNNLGFSTAPAAAPAAPRSPPESPSPPAIPPINCAGDTDCYRSAINSCGADTACLAHLRDTCVPSACFRMIFTTVCNEDNDCPVLSGAPAPAPAAAPPSSSGSPDRYFICFDEEDDCYTRGFIQDCTSKPECATLLGRGDELKWDCEAGSGSCHTSEDETQLKGFLADYESTHPNPLLDVVSYNPETGETKIGCFDGWICAKEEDIQDAIAFHRAMEARAGINSIQEGIAAAQGWRAFFGLFGLEEEWGRWWTDEEAYQWFADTISPSFADFASTNWEDSICSATPDFSAPISYVFLQGNSVGASIQGTTTKTTYLRENPSTGAREFVDDTLYLVTGSVSPYGATKNSIEYADDPDNCEDILEFSIVVYRASTAVTLPVDPTNRNTYRLYCNSGPVTWSGATGHLFYGPLDRKFDKVCLVFDNPDQLDPRFKEGLENGNQLCADFVDGGDAADLGCSESYDYPVGQEIAELVTLGQIPDLSCAGYTGDDASNLGLEQHRGGTTPENRPASLTPQRIG